jgi:uncharacterized protein YuzE
MEEMRVFYSKETDSLDIWFDDPKKEVMSEEIEDGVLAKKDKKGNVIGFEIISIKAGEVKLPIKAKMKK